MDTMQHKVLDFDMPPADFDPNFIPENGIQYLQQVVYERSKCPAVVVKPRKKQHSPENSTELWQEINNVIHSSNSLAQ